MKSVIVEQVISEMEECLEWYEQPSINQIADWANELRNAIKEDAA